MSLSVLGYMIAAAIIAVATAPIPGTSMFLLVLELWMIANIAKRRGHQLHLGEVSTVGGMIFTASEFLKALSVEILTVIPILGWLAKPVVAAGAVLVFAAMANSYFAGRPGSRIA